MSDLAGNPEDRFSYYSFLVLHKIPDCGYTLNTKNIEFYGEVCRMIPELPFNECLICSAVLFTERSVSVEILDASDQYLWKFWMPHVFWTSIRGPVVDQKYACLINFLIKHAFEHVMLYNILKLEPLTSFTTCQ